MYRLSITYLNTLPLCGKWQMEVKVEIPPSTKVQGILSTIFMKEGIINKEFMEKVYMMKEFDMMLIKKFIVTLLNNYPINSSEKIKIGFINKVCYCIRQGYKNKNIGVKSGKE